MIGNSNWSFEDLNLTGAEVQKGGRTLKPGQHICRTSDAEITKTKAGGRQLKITLNEINGAGYVTDYITLTHPKVGAPGKEGENAKMAVKIGNDRLKTLLTYGGHPNPDRPGDIKSLNGLVTGVVVEQGEPWTDDKGVQRPGGGKPAKNGCYYPPNGAVPAAAAAEPEQRRGIDDDIPF